MKEIFEVPEHLRNVLRVLDENRARLERSMNMGPAATAFRAEDSAAAAELARASATLGREYRNWLGHIRTSFDQLTPGRKMQVFVQYAQDLPLSLRRDLYLILAKLEADRPDGLGLSLVNRFDGVDPPAQVAGTAEDTDVGN